MCVKLGHAQLQLSSAKKTFTNSGLSEGEVKMCIFQRKN